MEAPPLPSFSLDALQANALPMLERLGEQFAATPLIGLALGAVLLLFGRRLFWLALTAVGLLVGFTVSQRFLPQADLWVSLFVGLLAGLVAVALAIFIQKLAVAVAAFLVGGYAVLWLATHFGLLETASVAGAFQGAGDATPWIVFLVGGAVAALFGQFFFRLALIVISSIAGAFLVAQSLPIEPQWTGLTLGVLVVIGLVFQSRGKKS